MCVLANGIDCIFSLLVSMCAKISGPIFSLNYKNFTKFLILTKIRNFCLTLCPQNYLKDAWNVFDFVTVLGSITDILVTEINVREYSLLTALILSTHVHPYGTD